MHSAEIVPQRENDMP